MTFRIYGAEASMAVTGYGPFTDGTTLQLSSCTTYSMWVVSVASGVGFWYWYGSGASIGNPSSVSTTLTPTASGTVVLVLQYSAGSWAGYDESASAFTQATGAFVVPALSYVGSGVAPNNPPPCIPANEVYDAVSIWVGIGGVHGNLWQAGVFAFVAASGAVYYVAFYEAPELPGTAGDPQWDCQFVVNTGDTVQVQVSYGGGTSSMTMTDATSDSSPWNHALSFTPDQTTADWIVEPACSACTAPQTTVVFSGCSTNIYANLLAPIEGDSTSDYTGHLINPQTLTAPTTFQVSAS